VAVYKRRGTGGRTVYVVQVAHAFDPKTGK
jgi:hypothetical protein